MSLWNNKKSIYKTLISTRLFKTANETTYNAYLIFMKD
jgi:flavorubredoxin